MDIEEIAEHSMEIFMETSIGEKYAKQMRDEDIVAIETGIESE